MTSSFAARRVPNRIPWSRSTFNDPKSVILFYPAFPGSGNARQFNR